MVGGNLVRALLEKGRTVRVLVHEDRRALEGLDVEVVQGDIRNLEQVLQAVRGVEVVYHLAAEISLEMNTWPQVEAINVLGVRHVVEACQRCGVQRLIHFSSIHALRPEPLDQVLDETRPLVVTDRIGGDGVRIPPYDRSKALGELEVRRGMDQGLNAVILEPTAVVGPWDFKPSYFGRALVLMARGKMPALVAGGFDWVDVRDVVAGAVQAEQAAPSGAKYLLGGHWHSVREVAVLAAGTTGRRAPIFTVPRQLAEAAAPAMALLARLQGGEPIYTKVALRALESNRQVSHDRAAQALGYTARPLAETIGDTLHWFEANGY